MSVKQNKGVSIAVMIFFFAVCFVIPFMCIFVPESNWGMAYEKTSGIQRFLGGFFLILAYGFAFLFMADRMTGQLDKEINETQMGVLKAIFIYVVLLGLSYGFLSGFDIPYNAK